VSEQVIGSALLGTEHNGTTFSQYSDA